jgi:MFS family permease
VFTYYFVGLTFGDMIGGVFSQWLKSRKKAIRIFLFMFTVGAIVFFTFGRYSKEIYYFSFLFLGFTVGYSIVLLTLAAEQFGTNIRATVTTSSLNLIRATVIPQTLLFGFLTPYFGEAKSAMVVCVLAILIAFWGLSNLDETFDKDLNFTE